MVVVWIFSSSIKIIQKTNCTYIISRIVLIHLRGSTLLLFQISRNGIDYQSLLYVYRNTDTQFCNLNGIFNNVFLWSFSGVRVYLLFIKEFCLFHLHIEIIKCLPVFFIFILKLIGNISCFVFYVLRSLQWVRISTFKSSFLFMCTYWDP